jgi:hypothetical protein
MRPAKRRMPYCKMRAILGLPTSLARLQLGLHIIVVHIVRSCTFACIDMHAHPCSYNAHSTRYMYSRTACTLVCSSYAHACLRRHPCARVNKQRTQQYTPKHNAHKHTHTHTCTHIHTHNHFAMYRLHAHTIHAQTNLLWAWKADSQRRPLYVQVV